MALPIYLAMTAWEYRNCSAPPEHLGWMACHFSSYGAGLSNIPEHFPEGGLLMVNDRIPPTEHSPDLITQQLLQAVETLSPIGVILDFQRPFHEKIREITEKIFSVLPCPVAVTDTYSQNWGGAVFAPPVPLGRKVEDFLQNWRSRDIWLEVSKAGETLVLTKEGCTRQPLCQLPDKPVFRDDNLFCHYNTQVTDEQAVFSLWRTDEDLADLLEHARAMGVSAAVGLYQEFC